MTLEVLETGPLVTVQDRGRVGLAHLGVPRAGALDPRAAGLGNRLVGNGPDAAVLEVVLGGLVLRSTRGRWIAVTGADVDVRIDGRAASLGRPEWLPAGSVLALGRPRVGLRSYVAVGGGIAVPLVLGSRSTDTLAWVGPSRVEPGAVLPVGHGPGSPRPTDVPPGDARACRRRPGELVSLRVVAGPRADWCGPDAVDRVCRTVWSVAADSDRVGLRLAGRPLERARVGELPPEGIVSGAVQVPLSGLPVVFLADHPTTGGYPVVAVVAGADLWRCAQLRPGDPVRFERFRPDGRRG